MFKTLMKLYFDNRSAIYIAQSLFFHERTKHIEVDCHVVGEKYEKYDAIIVVPKHVFC